MQARWFQLARQFGTALVLALAAPGAAFAQTRVTTTPVVQSETTAAGVPFVYPETKHPEITSLLVEIQPGGETGRHLHPSPTFVYVLEGTLDVRTDDAKVRTFRAGDGFVEVQNTWHEGWNHGSTPVRLLVVFVGTRGRPNVVRPE